MGMSLTSTIGVIPHYFKRRKVAAYMGLGLGSGIGFAAYPYITKSALDTFGYRYGMLILLSIFTISLVTPIIFKPRIQHNQTKDSMSKILLSYSHTVRHFAMPFYVVNTFLIVGSRNAVKVILFSFISEQFGSASVAVTAYTIYGVSFLISIFLLTLYGLKFTTNYFIFFLTTNLAYGAVLCCIPFVTHTYGIYICSVVAGACFGLSFGFKGNVVVHLFPPPNVTYVYGLSEAVGGVSAFTVPLAAGYIQEYYSKHRQGYEFYFVGGCSIAGGVVLCAAALARPKLWREYEKRCLQQPPLPESRSDPKLPTTGDTEN